jgi:hypothetical protein
MTFSLNQKSIMDMERVLNELSKMAAPIAIQQTLNNTARNAWKKGRNLTPKKFQLRNTWTMRSEQYTQTKDLNISTMKSIFGSTSGYMEQQEKGFTRNSTDGVTVPTATAANQSGMNRTKPVTRRFRRSNINRKQIVKRYQWTNKKQQAIADIIETMRAGDRFWSGTLKGTKGIWFLKGGRIKSKRGGWPKGMRPHLIYSANKKSVRTKGSFLVKEASSDALDNEFKEYSKALKRQLKRLKEKYNL